MDEDVKIWIKSNWYRPLFHILSAIITIVIVFTFLDMWNASIRADDMIWTIFTTITMFGAILIILLISIFMELWSWQFIRYKKEIENYKENK